MPGSKDKGHVQGSPQQKHKARREYKHRSTKNKTQKKIKETQIDSLAESSTPVKPKSRPKKQSQLSKSATSPTKQAPAPVNLPSSKRGIKASIVVTATKKKESQGKSSEDEESSTRSEESKKDNKSQHEGSDGEEIPAKSESGS